VTSAWERRLPKVLRASEIVLGLATLGFVGYLFLHQLAPSLFLPDAPLARISPIRAGPPPRVIPVFPSRSLIIPAGEHADTSFIVSDPRPCTLTGSVSGVSAGGRDVEVFILDEAGYDDWHNGVTPRPLFYSGRAADTSLDLPLPGRGTFYFLISNRYSIFTDKIVRVRDVRVTCTTAISHPDLSNHAR
jgi:hypothetical protein